MKKVFAVLLLISAVIGMAMPGMANPSARVDKVVNIDVDGTNWAVNKISQSQNFEGDQTNNAVVALVGGDADARSNADADGNAQNSGDAEVEDDDSGLSAALAGNLLSGNGVAISGAEANAGNAHNNGDVVQVNAVVQVATADITNLQVLKQKVNVYENINPSVEVDESIFDNEVEGDDNEIELED